LDEVAVWWNSELAANPDTEILRALKPAMITQPDSLLIGLSSPYAKRGLLYEKHRDHFGRDNSNVLVWQADTATMNPQVDKQEIAQAYRDDPLSASAEFGAQFRSDLEAFVSADVVRACVDDGVFERPPEDRVRYFGFCDPSGGSGADSMTLAVAHRQKDNVIVLDALREVRPPFVPTTIVAEFVEVCRSYRVGKISGDRYASEWCQLPFREAGVGYQVCERSKSDLYVAALPLLNSGRVRLLDNRKLIGQLISLERSTARGSGKDTVDHPKGQHDDVCNSACGVIGLAKHGGYPVDLSWVSDDTPDAAAQRWQDARFQNHIYAHSGYYRGLGNRRW
jgi:hypothetical protein